MVIPCVVADLSDAFLKEVEPHIQKLMREHSGKNSFDPNKRKRIERGCTGDLLVCRYYQTPFVGSYHFDCRPYGERLENKTCNGEVTPQHDWLCKVEAHNIEQDCDHYCFVRLRSLRTRAWILGTIPKWVFRRDAKFLDKGEPDPFPPHKPMPAACWWVTADKLTRPESQYIKL